MVCERPPAAFGRLSPFARGRIQLLSPLQRGTAAERQGVAEGGRGSFAGLFPQGHMRHAIWRMFLSDSKSGNVRLTGLRISIDSHDKSIR